MDVDFLNYTASAIHNCQPLEPQPTDTAAVLKHLEGVKAVLFDIYGTLLISASGDVDIQDFKPEEAAGILTRANLTVPEGGAARIAADTARLYYAAIQESHQRSREAGIPYPEVDAIAIWENVVEKLREAGAVTGLTEPDYQRIAFMFEMVCNPVYPMPGMADIITALAARGIRLGIVSNAQFFTPIIMQQLLHGTVNDAHAIEPFEPELTVYSFQAGRAKPDSSLYTGIRDILQEQGIAPHEVIMVGNDMLNDIAASARAGFRTVLFAGDRRSLRLRTGHPDVEDIQPDAVINVLAQLLEITGESE